MDMIFKLWLIGMLAGTLLLLLAAKDPARSFAPHEHIAACSWVLHNCKTA